MNASRRLSLQTLVHYQLAYPRPKAAVAMKRKRLNPWKRLVCTHVKAGLSDDDLKLLSGKAMLMRDELAEKERLLDANWAKGNFSSGAFQFEDWVRLVRVSGTFYE